MRRRVWVQVVGLVFLSFLLPGCGNEEGSIPGNFCPDCPTCPDQPYQLEVVAGGGQSEVVGNILAHPVTWLLTDAEGEPLQGQRLEFSTEADGAILNPRWAHTGFSGQVQVLWTLGTTSGEQRMHARLAEAPGFNATCEATARPDVPASLVCLEGDGQAGTVGLALADPLVFQVEDQHGNPVPGAELFFDDGENEGVFDPVSAVTDSLGRASTRWTPGREYTNVMRARLGEDLQARVEVTAYGGWEIEQAVATFGTIDLSWQMGPSWNFAGYRIFRDTDPGVDESSTLVAAITEREQTTFADSTVVSGVEYYYQLWVDLADGQTIRSQPRYVRSGLRVEVPGEPWSLILDPLRNRLYVSLYNEQAIAVIDAESLALVETITLPDQGRPHLMTLGLDGNTLYCALVGGRAVAVLDLETQAMDILPVSALGDDRTYLAREIQPGVLLVTGSPSSFGLAYAVKVDMNDGMAQTRVGGGRSFRTRPNILVDPAGLFIYLTEDANPGSIYKLDATDPLLPIVQEDAHGSIDDPDRVVMSPDGELLYLFGGQVVSTETLSPVGQLGYGHPLLSADGRRCYQALEESIEVYDAVNFTHLDAIPLPTRVNDYVWNKAGDGFYTCSDEGNVVWGIKIPVR